jgi:hypothetical protein
LVRHFSTGEKDSENACALHWKPAGRQGNGPPLHTAKEGQLSFVTLEETTVALLVRDPHAALDGAAYMITTSIELDGSATSFHRNSAGLVSLHSHA